MNNKKVRIFNIENRKFANVRKRPWDLEDQRHIYVIFTIVNGLQVRLVEMMYNLSKMTLSSSLTSGATVLRVTRILSHWVT